MLRFVVAIAVTATATLAYADPDPYLVDLEARHHAARMSADRAAAHVAMQLIDEYWDNRNVVAPATPITLDPDDVPVSFGYAQPPEQPSEPDWGWDVLIHAGSVVALAADEDVASFSLYAAVAYNSGGNAFVETYMSPDGGAGWLLVTTYTWNGHTVDDIDLKVVSGSGVSPQGVYAMGVFDGTIVRCWGTALGGGPTTSDVQVVADADPKRHVRFDTDHEPWPTFWYLYGLWEQDLAGNPSSTIIVHYISEDYNVTWGTGPMYPFDSLGTFDFENADVHEFWTDPAPHSNTQLVANTGAAPREVYWTKGFTGFDAPVNMSNDAAADDFSPTITTNNDPSVPADVMMLWVKSTGADDYVTGVTYSDTFYAPVFHDTVLFVAGNDVAWPSLSDVVMNVVWSFSCVDNTGAVRNMTTYSFPNFTSPSEVVNYQHACPSIQYRPLDCAIVSTFLGPGTAWMASNGAYWSAQALDVDSERPLPSSFTMRPIAPNPFNPSASISFDLPVGSHVRVDAFDALGRRVTCITDRFYPAGTHRVRFDGLGLASGVYVLRMLSAGGESVQKAVLLK